MNVDRVGKEIEAHGPHSAQSAPIARLRARFGIPAAIPALTPSTPVVAPILPEPPPDVSPWDLSPDLYERWEERVCIMHYDGNLPWHEAEKAALADVLGQPSLLAEEDDANGASQGRLFADMERGPY